MREHRQTLSISQIRELNHWVGRGIREGWLNGDEADTALDRVAEELVARIDADSARLEAQWREMGWLNA